MHRKQRRMLILSGVLSILGVLLCIWRMTHWEQGAAVNIVSASTGAQGEEVFATACLYAVTIALIIRTAVLSVRWWNQWS